MTARALRYASLLALLGLSVTTAAALYLQGMGVAPRALGPYVGQRSAGHNPLVSGIGSWLQERLLSLDRSGPGPYAMPSFSVGAMAMPSSQASDQACWRTPGCRRLRKFASSPADVRAAVQAAQPGDVITLLPGTYRFGAGLVALAAGTEQAPITVRAERHGSVVIQFDTVEGFAVSGPWWRFENLIVQGACTIDARCEHAFHVAGDAHHFVAVNNSISDFNAHFKINGSGGRFPDHGLIDHNTLANSAPRKTAGPVTPIDLVGASGWTIRANYIADFIKAQGDRVSYGAFAKGAGAGTTIAGNVVLCEQRLQGQPGQRVGLSFGGGGTGKPYCRDRRCITEQDHGVIRDNLVAACSDAGIYINSAADTQIIHNTLLDTGGIDVRFPESGADVISNLVDGTIRARNGARVRALDNLDTPIAYLYAGYHPVRRLFENVRELNLRWKAAPPRRAITGAAVDMCGRARPVWASYGAFENFADCVR
ncbi:right-handed parallel beta-helix repeat-containing protein [Massilia agilis]|uniref:Right-handed parallel beta-helix repeat-containing protein n=1 Tax=Massilia agilis TaxID=1811226 RepID=A0ABT2DFE0_9BURK|nr:chondroitinase-B domain-containing protein [Massilia agilis]MCS0809136.1 right-handed parallel beta-helix repeat-containing protein [Massilia agilis]